MSVQDEFIASVRSTDSRIEVMRDQILAGGDKPLLEGTWRVRDALSHLAARSNGVARVLQRVEAAANAGDAPPAPRNIDEINAGQVDERSTKSVAELLDEIREGHQSAITAAQQIDDAILTKSIPLGFRPGEATVAQLLVMGGPGHDNNHLDQVEAALNA